MSKILGVESRDSGSPFPGYGQPGEGAWGPGMVWQPWSNSSTSSTEQSMRLSAVFGCLRILSEAIATLPVDVFQSADTAPSLYRPVPDFLTFQPPHLSRINYMSQIMLSLLTNGNAFIATPRNPMGVVVGLMVLEPGAVQVSAPGGIVRFKIGNSYFDEYDVMHIKGMSMPGALLGMSPLAYARDVVDGTQKAQNYGRAFLANSAVPPAVIEMPSDASDVEAARAKAERVKAAWNAQHSGTENAGKIGVLLGGAKLTTVAITPADAEWMDSKKFSISEIARFFGVPPHLIADASNSTSWGSGLAEQNAAFGAFALRPWIERIEDGHSRLLTSMGLATVSLKMDVDSLLRADLNERLKAYSVAVAAHIMTPNDCRIKEDMPPIAGGDDFPIVKAMPSAGSDKGTE